MRRRKKSLSLHRLFPPAQQPVPARQPAPKLPLLLKPVLLVLKLKFADVAERCKPMVHGLAKSSDGTNQGC